jgi:hypothetical protein
MKPSSPFWAGRRGLLFQVGVPVLQPSPVYVVPRELLRRSVIKALSCAGSRATPCVSLSAPLKRYAVLPVAQTSGRRLARMLAVVARGRICARRTVGHGLIR